MNEVLDEIVKLGSKMKRMYKKRTAVLKRNFPEWRQNLEYFLLPVQRK